MFAVAQINTTVCQRTDYIASALNFAGFGVIPRYPKMQRCTVFIITHSGPWPSTYVTSSIMYITKMASSSEAVSGMRSVLVALPNISKASTANNVIDGVKSIVRLVSSFV